jgi:hypothetical protein
MKHKDDDLFDIDGDLQAEDIDQIEVWPDDQELPELTDDDYDEDELERRRVAYAELKKNDKIYNNTYNLGFEANEEDDEDSGPRRSKTDIKLDSGSVDYHLQDNQRYSEYVDQMITQKDIFNFISANQEIQAILGNEPEKKKFTKIELNRLFNLILHGLSSGKGSTNFISSIHVLDAISGTVNMEYKKLFDSMSYENKEILLIELDKSYGFLSGKTHKMF